MEDRISQRIAGGIADVRLNRAAKTNALDPAMFLAIAELGVRHGCKADTRRQRCSFPITAFGSPKNSAGLCTVSCT